MIFFKKKFKMKATPQFQFIETNNRYVIKKQDILVITISKENSRNAKKYQLLSSKTSIKSETKTSSKTSLTFDLDEYSLVFIPCYKKNKMEFFVKNIKYAWKTVKYPNNYIIIVK